MRTGYNTDIQHEGRTYHVQTEDRGRDNPVIESLIYVGGEILASRRQVYADKAAAGITPEAISELLDRQHQAVVRDIRLGKYDPPESRLPFGTGIITDRSLDEVVREFIEEAAASGTLPEPPRPPRRKE